jgi:hypothetical protein
MLRASMVVSSILLLLYFFEWSIIDVVTPFLFLPLEGLIWVVFLAVVIGSIVHWIRNRQVRQSWLPLLICAVVVFLVFTVPFTKIWLRIDFILRRNARERIVEEISLGKLQAGSPSADGTRSVRLPDDAPHVAYGGNEVFEQVVDGKIFVFFFTYRGIMSSYAGFLFVPTGADPSAFSDLNETSRIYVERYSEHWYYASHH